MKKLIILSGLLAGLSAALILPTTAEAEDEKTCSPACKKNQSCYCTFKNGSVCVDDHAILGACTCRCA